MMLSRFTEERIIGILREQSAEPQRLMFATSTGTAKRASTTGRPCYGGLEVSRGRRRWRMPAEEAPGKCPAQQGERSSTPVNECRPIRRVRRIPPACHEGNGAFYDGAGGVDPPFDRRSLGADRRRNALISLYGWWGQTCGPIHTPPSTPRNGGPLRSTDGRHHRPKEHYR
jgi:hypothetical protein